MRKILFLDIDGVLNSDAHYERLQTDPEKINRLCQEEGHSHIINPYTLMCFDPEAIKRLNRITETTGAEIVFSSNWLLDISLEDMRDLFAVLRVSGDILDKTPRGLQYSSRTEEIEAWLSDYKDKHGYTPVFGILEDQHNLGHLRRYTIYTTYAEGMQDLHADLMIQRLSRK
jgi:hypothetical protein